MLQVDYQKLHIFKLRNYLDVALCTAHYIITYKNFIPTVLATTKPNYLLILGLLLLLKPMSNNHLMAVETFLLGVKYSDLPSRDSAP